MAMIRSKLLALLLLTILLASCQDKTPPPDSLPTPLAQDSVDVMAIAKDTLDGVYWKGFNDSEGNDSLLEHWLLAEKSFPSRKILLVASNGAGNECHACSPYVSVFEFRKVDSAWRMTGSDIAFARAGAWGKLAPELVRLEPLDTTKVAILLTTSFMGQGNLETNLEAHLWDSEFSYTMFSAEVGSSNAGALTEEDSAQLVDWTADAELLPHGSGFPQLRVIRHGIQEGDSLRDTSWFDFDGPTKAELTPDMDVLLPRNYAHGKQPPVATIPR